VQVPVPAIKGTQAGATQDHLRDPRFDPSNEYGKSAPRYLLRDQDRSYGQGFRDRVRVMGIEELITAPRSPWKNPFVERVIGSIRRECLDHVIIINERHLRRVLTS
jgi:hypothetical protein